MKHWGKKAQVEIPILGAILVAMVGAIGGSGIALILIGLAIAVPLFIGGLAGSIKIIQLLFYTPIGGFPVWALFIVTICLFILVKKLQKKGMF